VIFIIVSVVRSPTSEQTSLSVVDFRITHHVHVAHYGRPTVTARAGEERGGAREGESGGARGRGGGHERGGGRRPPRAEREGEGAREGERGSACGRGRGRGRERGGGR
jgi:hypothetical protein